MVMAGGAGGRMGVLTQVRAKPALPYAGSYRLIDFPLSNCVHSGLLDVWLLEAYQPSSINAVISNGRPWDLDRTYGGLRLLPPKTGMSGEGFPEGNVDTIYRNREEIRAFSPDLVLVLSADHVYKLDYRDVLDQHLEVGADVTMVTTEVPQDQVRRAGVVETSDGRVTGFEYKPDLPKTSRVTCEVFGYDTRKLMDTLDELVAEDPDDEGSGSSLGDFGDTLVPRLVDDGKAYEHFLDGYWRDVGTPESYWESHMQLLESEPKFILDDPSWPILTAGIQRPGARIESTAHIEGSLISPGCTVRGEVVSSVLAPGVTVEEGAQVHRCVILQDTIVGTQARVRRTIVDTDVRIGRRAEIGGDSESNLVLIGSGAQIGNNGYVAAGTSIEPAAIVGDS